MTLFLVDISSYQAGINIAQVAREGFVAAACKATEGVGFRDPQFDTFIPQVQAAGMIPGAYHYLRAGDGAEQARQFLARVRDHGGPGGWLIQLDCESDGYGREMAAWAAEWVRLTDNHPFLIYSAAFWWPRTGGFRGADLTPYLWHAHYVSGGGTASQLYGQVPPVWFTPGYGGWPSATFLQFTDSAQVAGRSIDASAFLGTLDQLKALTGGVDVAIDETDFQALVWRVEALINGRPEVIGGPTTGEKVVRPAATVTLSDADRTAIVNAVTGKVDALAAKVDALAARLAAAAQAEADKLKG